MPGTLAQGVAPQSLLVCRLQTSAPYRVTRKRHSGTDSPKGPQMSLVCSPPSHHPGFLGFQAIFMAKPPAGLPAAQAGSSIPQRSEDSEEPDKRSASVFGREALFYPVYTL